MFKVNQSLDFKGFTRFFFFLRELLQMVYWIFRGLSSQVSFRTWKTLDFVFEYYSVFSILASSLWYK